MPAYMPNEVITYQGESVFRRKQGPHPVAASPYVEKPDYHNIDINILENEHPRSVGA